MAPTRRCDVPGTDFVDRQTVYPLIRRMERLPNGKAARELPLKPAGGAPPRGVCWKKLNVQPAAFAGTRFLLSL